MKKIVFVLYFLFLLFFVFFSYLFIDPGLFYLRSLFTNFFQVHRTITTVIFTICIFIFFGFYATFLYWIKTNMLTRRTIFYLIGVSAILLLFAYPGMLSFDIFNYIATAKVTFFYHENPYLIMPIEFTRDPLLLFMHAANKTALYAPFWILLTGIPYALGFGNFLITLLNFKLLVGAFYGLTVWLLWKMTKDIFRTTLFALNPLVLIETFISSHNDIVMMFLLLAGLYFLFEKRKGWGIVLFILSIGIKYVTLITLPFYGWAIFKQISKRKIFFLITFAMYSIFFLSSFREEIYPWYSLWFLLPITFIAENTLFTWISFTFSFSMMLRYIPFMLLGTYFGPTPLLKIILMIIPIGISCISYVLTQKNKRII